MIGGSHYFAAREAGGYGILGRQTRALVHDVEYLPQWSASRIGRRPSGHALGDGVKPCHLALGVGGDDGVPDRL